MKKTKVLEAELADQSKKLAEQKIELVDLKKQVEKLLAASEEMAGRISILERSSNLSENYMVMSLERSEVKEPAKKRPAPPAPLRPDAPETAETNSEVGSEETTPAAPTRPLISKPVLQNTTPNAASQIAKAPSTGVSQSSILATNKEKDTTGPLKPLRRAVFSDQIILPLGFTI